MSLVSSAPVLEAGTYSEVNCIVIYTVHSVSRIISGHVIRRPTGHYA